MDRNKINRNEINNNSGNSKTGADDLLSSNRRSFRPTDIFYKIIFPFFCSIPKQISSKFSTATLRLFLNAFGLSDNNKNGSQSKLRSEDQFFAREKIALNLEFHRALQPHSGVSTSPRRLVLLYTWVTAKKRHIQKYSRLLTALGNDVLVVRCFPRDLLTPTTGTQMVGERVCQFLSTEGRNYDKLLVYGCSVGLYMFGETVIKLRNDPELHDEVMSKFAGQIWDSPVDCDHVHIGIAHTLTVQPLLQTVITSSTQFMLKMCYSFMTRHFKAASEVLHECPVKAPCYFFYSSNDPMSPHLKNKKVVARWRDELHIDIGGRVFEHENTGHVLNFPTYPEEYTRLVYAFMERVGMAEEKDVQTALKQFNYSVN